MRIRQVGGVDSLLQHTSGLPGDRLCVTGLVDTVGGVVPFAVLGVAPFAVIGNGGLLPRTIKD